MKKFLKMSALGLLAVLFVFTLISQFDEDLNPNLKVLLDAKEKERKNSLGSDPDLEYFLKTPLNIEAKGFLCGNKSFCPKDQYLKNKNELEKIISAYAVDLVKFDRLLLSKSPSPRPERTVGTSHLSTNLLKMARAKHLALSRLLISRIF